MITDTTQIVKLNYIERRFHSSRILTLDFGLIRNPYSYLSTYLFP
jgi:hypothetical protein